MVKMIPLYKPFMPNELPELNKILYSGTLSYGKWGKAFEKKLAKYIGNPNIAVINSFNSAMLVVLSTLEVKAGDEIIASPVSCLASNQPFVSIGARVVWADIDPESGTLSPEEVEKKITRRTKAIFHNHYCGYPGYIDEINEIGKKHEIFVVDDAIEAFGSEYKGKKVGNTGTDATVFSFQTVRLPNTIDGGAISFKETSHYEKAIKVRDLGIDRTLFRDSIGEISLNCDISLPGYGATLSEANSYIGFMQMKYINALISQQRENANKWKERLQFESRECKELGTREEVNPNYWIYGVFTSDKSEFIKDFRERGFYASAVHLPNNYYSVFGRSEELPGVKEFYSRFAALPSGWWFNL